MTCVQRTTVRKSVHSVRAEIEVVPCQSASVSSEVTLLKIQKCCLSAQPSFFSVEGFDILISIVLQICSNLYKVVPHGAGNWGNS